MQRNELIKGFPGLLHTLKTSLDKSPTIKQISKYHKQMSMPQSGHTKTPFVKPAKRITRFVSGILDV